MHVYTDGSVLLNHGGTEMGQGLFTKVAQVVAQELGVGARPRARHRRRHEQGANTSPTAASSGSDLNGMAAQDAARKLRGRAGRGSSRPGTAATPDDVALRRRRGARRASGASPFADGRARRLPRPRAALGDRLLRDAEDPLRPQDADRPPVLLLRLRRGGVRGRRRHADRRVRGCCASTSCTTSARRSTRRSTSARSRAASSRAWAG